MNDVERLEMLSESIKKEIDELQSLLEHSDSFLLKSKSKKIQNSLVNIISNLESTNDSIYQVFEELDISEGYIQDLENKCDVFQEILKEKLSDDEITYIRIKHNIEF